jgi:hypothetical protein
MDFKVKKAIAYIGGGSIREVQEGGWGWKWMYIRICLPSSGGFQGNSSERTYAQWLTTEKRGEYAFYSESGHWI